MRRLALLMLQDTLLMRRLALLMHRLALLMRRLALLMHLNAMPMHSPELKTLRFYAKLFDIAITLVDID
ncbi:MAG: hypothetical protein V7K88_29215 [Nostoc sp.]|uniref:hypothetical protein n=1 Tax=Nostoc sp. TaxID=1180 RepID=UPI002FF7B081